MISKQNSRIDFCFIENFYKQANTELSSYLSFLIKLNGVLYNISNKNLDATDDEYDTKELVNLVSVMW